MHARPTALRDASDSRIRLKWLFHVLLNLVLAIGSAKAQDPRSARVDTARVPTDGAPARALSGMSAVDEGAWRATAFIPLILPVATRDYDVAHLLAALPGSFLYDFSTPGWPHGWSPDGLAPHQISFSMNELSFVDPVTGVPRLDLAPMAFVRPIEVGSSPFGAPVHVGLNLRSYGTDRPLTEMRYQRADAGFQAIEAVHVQNRVGRFFGHGGPLQVLGGYSGRAAAGEYPGSRLRRARHVLARIRFVPPGWSFEVYNHHTRQRVGAHAGVLPRPGEPFESVYDRFGANVANPGARRRTVRNDLVARISLPIFGRAEQTEFQPYWSAQTFDYVNQGDTASAKGDRAGFLLRQPVQVAGMRPVLQAHVWRDAYALSWSDSNDTDVQLHVQVRDTASVGPLRLILAGGGHRIGRLYPVASASARITTNGLVLFLLASSGVDWPSLVVQRGFSGFVEPTDGATASRVSILRGGLHVAWGALDVGITGFANRVAGAIELVPVTSDTARATVFPGSYGYGGVTVEAGIRRYERRGVYGRFQSTVLAPTTATEPFGRSDVFPRRSGRGRAGGRVLLFRGDLDLDAYVEIRAWSRMRSRSLHAPTGLLILPEAGSPIVPTSSTVGAYVEAGVREATLFLGYENVLSGTSILAGNMNVPVYPLAERHFRFGVYWPIWD